MEPTDPSNIPRSAMDEPMILSTHPAATPPLQRSKSANGLTSSVAVSALDPDTDNLDEYLFKTARNTRKGTRSTSSSKAKPNWQGENRKRDSYQKENLPVSHNTYPEKASHARERSSVDKTEDIPAGSTLLHGNRPHQMETAESRGDDEEDLEATRKQIAAAKRLPQESNLRKELLEALIAMPKPNREPTTQRRQSARGIRKVAYLAVDGFEQQRLSGQPEDSSPGRLSRAGSEQIAERSDEQNPLMEPAAHHGDGHVEAARQTRPLDADLDARAREQQGGPTWRALGWEAACFFGEFMVKLCKTLADGPDGGRAMAGSSRLVGGGGELGGEVVGWLVRGSPGHGRGSDGSTMG